VNVFPSRSYQLCSNPEVQILMLPRTVNQGKALRLSSRKRRLPNIFTPDRADDGPRTIHRVDLVISGGGTMNREAASLGIRVNSTCQGPIRAVDRHLVDSGRLMRLSTMDMVKETPLVRTQGSILVSDRNSDEEAPYLTVGKIMDRARRGTR
jgi:predicted glycosyltransferase